MECEQELSIPKSWEITADNLKDLGIQPNGTVIRTNDGLIRYVITFGKYCHRRCHYNYITKTWHLENY